jgi:hypothetical protein
VVHFGTSSGNYTATVDTGKSTIYKVERLVDGTRYYFVVTAYTSSGLSSAPSQEVSATVASVVSLVSNGQSPAPTGVPMTWTATGVQGVNLEYEFWRFSQTSGAWTMVRNYSASNTFTWTPGSGEQGTYQMQVWARTPGSTDIYQAYRSSSQFTVSNGGIKIGELAANVAFPASTGTPITWTALAVGGPAPLKYQFWRYSLSAGTWTMVQDYSTDNTYTWTPGATAQGRYAIQAWVRANGSTAAQDAWKSTGFFEIQDGPIQVASLTPNVHLPAGTGGAITWTADAVGPGPLEYQFWRYSKSSNQWTSVQSYSSKNTFTWTPTSTGTYALQVWVRKQGTTVTYAAYGATGQFQIANSTPTVVLTADHGPQIGTNQTVTWHAVATGGSGPLQYQFWLYNQATETWAVVQAYSTNPDFIWNAPPGAYAIQVFVRRASSTAAYDAWASTGNFTVQDAKPTAQLVSSISSSTVAVGTPITWTAIAGGGPGPLEYEFWGYNFSTGAWTLLQDYSWNNQFSWVPLAADAGTYGIQVWVRRSGTAAVFESFSSSTPISVR